MKKVHKDPKNRRKNRVRAKVQGSAARPRITVFRSNRYTYVQAINDLEGKTILSANTSLSGDSKKATKTEQSMQLGEKFGNELIKMKIETGVFDRGSYRYHGRVKSLADGIRKAGVKF